MFRSLRSSVLPTPCNHSRNKPSPCLRARYNLSRNTVHPVSEHVTTCRRTRCQLVPEHGNLSQNTVAILWARGTPCGRTPAHTMLFCPEPFPCASQKSTGADRYSNESSRRSSFNQLKVCYTLQRPAWFSQFTIGDQARRLLVCPPNKKAFLLAGRHACQVFRQLAAHPVRHSVSRPHWRQASCTAGMSVDKKTFLPDDKSLS